MLNYTRKGGALRDSGQEADDGRRHQAAVVMQINMQRNMASTGYPLNVYKYHLEGKTQGRSLS